MSTNKSFEAEAKCSLQHENNTASGAIERFSDDGDPARHPRVTAFFVVIAGETAAGNSNTARPVRVWMPWQGSFAQVIGSTQRLLDVRFLSLFCGMILTLRFSLSRPSELRLLTP